MATIKLNEVEKIYDRAVSPSVSNLSLEIESGEFLCLLGPSGCGKTTTLRMIAGLEHPTSGSITIGDQVVDSVEKGIFVPPEKRGLGLVFQSYALWPHLTIAENVDFGMRLKKVDKQTREKKRLEVMEALGISKYADRYPAELSGGQQQRVALARMLVVNPDVILLDEPLSNLDAKLRLDMRAELKRIHNEGHSTFVFVTHDQWEAMTLASTIAVMNEGKLLQVGTPTEIYDYPTNRFVAEFLGASPINIVEITRGETIFAKKISEYLGRVLPNLPKAASVGIRPESITVTSESQQSENDDFQIEAKLESVLPTGGSWILQLSAGGLRIFAITSKTPQLHDDKQVYLRIKKKNLHLFDGRKERIRPDYEPQL